MQPRAWLACWAASAHCWVMSSFSPPVPSSLSPQGCSQPLHAPANVDTRVALTQVQDLTLGPCFFWALQYQQALEAGFWTLINPTALPAECVPGRLLWGAGLEHPAEPQEPGTTQCSTTAQSISLLQPFLPQSPALTLALEAAKPAQLLLPAVNWGRCRHLPLSGTKTSAAMNPTAPTGTCPQQAADAGPGPGKWEQSMRQSENCQMGGELLLLCRRPLFQTVRSPAPALTYLSTRNVFCWWCHSLLNLLSSQQISYCGTAYHCDIKGLKKVPLTQQARTMQGLVAVQHHNAIYQPLTNYC